MRKVQAEKMPKGIIDLVTPLKAYRGKWVVLSEDNKKVLVWGGTPEIVMKKAEKKGIIGGTLMSVAKRSYDFYIG